METIPAKTIITSAKRPMAWFGAEYNMNLYRGCNHGCIYCDSRSSCYQNPRFDTVTAKANALRIVRDELSRKIKTGVVATGAMSDPYNPFEKSEQLTRNALQLLDAYGFGAAIATKSDLIVRDIDVLRDIHTHSPVLCKITVTTCDETLAAKLEPRAPSPKRRLTALRQLADAGLFCGILMMPVMPFLEDNPQAILEVIGRAHDAGARFIMPSFGVTMRAGQREYLLEHLDLAFPEENLAQRYRSRFGERYHATSPRARQLWNIFTKACDQIGLLYKMPDIIAAYRQGREHPQLSFL